MISIFHVAENIRKILLDMGQCPDSAEDTYSRILRIASDIFASGTTVVNHEEINKFITRLDDRVANREITTGFARHLRSVARRIHEYIDTGTVTWSVTPKGYTTYLIGNDYKSILDSFVQTKDHLAKSTIASIINTGRRHLCWLEKQKIYDLRLVSEDLLKRYIVESVAAFAGSTVKTELGHMRGFYSYLFATGHVSSNFHLILSSKIRDDRKIKPALGREEVETVLNSIDRSTAIGKRNYALLILAANTGLRAIDVVRLSLTDINWRRGEISVVQSKTGITNIIPLSHDVGTALQDYILNGRPDCATHKVFVRTLAPYNALGSSTSVGNIYKLCFEEVGLTRTTWDGRGFHSLRRSLALNMVVSGVPITTVAQVLGHSDLGTVKQYISLDSVHLKECALGFSGIELCEVAQ